MSFIGGDFLEATYNHPTVGSGTFLFKAGEDGTVNKGGLKTADDAGNVTGNGIMIQIMNYQRPEIELPPVMWDMTGKDELEKLNQMAASPVLADWTFTHVSGMILGGKGKPVGDIKGATNSAQIACKIAFEGKLNTIN